MHWWELARIGAIAIVGGGSDAAGISGHPSYVLTDFGRALLERRDVSPHDRAGYLSAICGVPGADLVAIGYADEAVGAWQAGLYRASAVMLGCACERLVLVVAEAVRDASISPYSADLAKMLTPPKRKKGPAAGISEIFERVRGAIEVIGGSGDEFNRLVLSVFDHARELRNESGHPTGRTVSREDAQAGLLLFPGYHARVLELINAVRSYAPRTP